MLRHSKMRVIESYIGINLYPSNVYISQFCSNSKIRLYGPQEYSSTGTLVPLSPTSVVDVDVYGPSGRWWSSRLCPSLTQEGVPAGFFGRDDSGTKTWRPKDLICSYLQTTKFDGSDTSKQCRRILWFCCPQVEKVGTRGVGIRSRIPSITYTFMTCGSSTT